VRDLPEIWGYAEVVAYLEVSQQRATRLMNRPDFPLPVVELAATRVWLADDVREWQRRRRERYPGPEESGEL
jgi:hypothetical protein